jgi:hypothetical protein
MVLKRARWPKPDIERAVADLEVNDEVLRGNAVRAFCPCHAGWSDFEQHINLVTRGLRDPSRIVRRNALHVFDDAVRMQLAADLHYYVEDGEEKIGEKRACARYRSMAERLEARREKRNRRYNKRS